MTSILFCIAVTVTWWMNMWNPRENEQEQQREGREKIVAVAIDKDKFSQHALKWAADNILSRHQTIKLVHVIQKSHSNNQYSGLSRCPLNFLDSFFFPVCYNKTWEFQAYLHIQSFSSAVCLDIGLYFNQIWKYFELIGLYWTSSSTMNVCTF